MSDSVPPIRVLLVDDSIEFRNVLRILLLRDSRFTVVGEASDGLQGLEMVKEHQPDIVLLDVAMPRMDGLQALPKIRTGWPSIKVVMLSAFSADEMAAVASQQGAHAYLEKGEVLEKMSEEIVRVHSE